MHERRRGADWTDIAMRWDWLVKHLILRALLPGLTPGEVKDLKRRERRAREWRRFCCVKAREEICATLARWEKLEPRQKPVQLRLPLPEPREAL
jgi:hypothetical protein